MENLYCVASRIRGHILKMTAEAQSGHPGGSLSATDILTALYFNLMNVAPDKMSCDQRDVFILSKGHAAPVFYSTLAEKGYLPVQELLSYRQINSRLQGHPDKNKTPGVNMTTGSLGQGLSVANGVAIAARLDNNPRWVYVLLGDGELQEGQVWEAVMSAAHYNLDRVICIVDCNSLQITGSTNEVMSVEPLIQKFEAFNWHTQEIDGHSFDEIISSVRNAKSATGRPSVIIARTVKGKGISFMENNLDWHGSAPNREQLAEALKELGVD